MGRHVDQVRVRREVRQAAAVGEKRLPQIAVLLDGVLDRLAGERVLESVGGGSA